MVAEVEKSFSPLLLLLPSLSFLQIACAVLENGCHARSRDHSRISFSFSSLSIFHRSLPRTRARSRTQTPPTRRRAPRTRMAQTRRTSGSRVHGGAEREETRSGTRSEPCGEEEGAVNNIMDEDAGHKEDGGG